MAECSIGHDGRCRLNGELGRRFSPYAVALFCDRTELRLSHGKPSSITSAGGAKPVVSISTTRRRMSTGLSEGESTAPGRWDVKPMVPVVVGERGCARSA